MSKLTQTTSSSAFVLKEKKNKEKVTLKRFKRKKLGKINASKEKLKQN